MQREAAGDAQVGHVFIHPEMAGAVAAEFLHHIAQAGVVDHQHAARPGIGGGGDGQRRAEAVAAHQHLLAFLEHLFLLQRFGLGAHRRLQHAQARGVVFALDDKPRAQRAQAAVAGLHIKRARIVVAGFDEDFAFLQHDQPALLIEAHVDGTVGVEVDQRAVRQFQRALLAGGGALVGQPIVDRHVAFAGKQCQAAHQRNTRQAAAQLAHALANALARLQQRRTRRARGHAETLVEHAQLAPGTGVFFITGQPFAELFSLHRAAITRIEGQLPGNRRIQHAGRHRLGADKGHSGSPYRAM